MILSTSPEAAAAFLCCIWPLVLHENTTATAIVHADAAKPIVVATQLEMIAANNAAGAATLKSGRTAWTWNAKGLKKAPTHAAIMSQSAGAAPVSRHSP